MSISDRSPDDPVPAGIIVKTVKYTYMDTGLSVLNDAKVSELNQIIEGLRNTPREPGSPPAGLEWRVEVQWSLGECQDSFVFYLLKTKKVIDVEGATAKKEKLQAWILENFNPTDK